MRRLCACVRGRNKTYQTVLFTSVVEAVAYTAQGTLLSCPNASALMMARTLLWVVWVLVLIDGGLYFDTALRNAPSAELLLFFSRVATQAQGVGSILVHEKVIREVIKDKGYRLVNVRGTSGGSRLDLPTRLCGTWACATTVRRQMFLRQPSCPQ